VQHPGRGHRSQPDSVADERVARHLLDKDDALLPLLERVDFCLEDFEVRKIV